MARLCSVEGCGRKYFAREYCKPHWDRFKKGIPMDTPIIRRDTVKPPMCRYCTFPVKGRGMCAMHYTRYLRHGNALTTLYDRKPLCSVEGCYDRVDARGWCSKHYHRWRINGDPLVVRRRVKSRAA
jgi:hypothetical protein